VDPEQIYTEVLAEEQQKGSVAPVAEGRAKAARQRALEGSPHPKEARWWPGSQPHFEGGGDAGAGASEEAVDDAAEAAAEEPAAEAEPAATPTHTPEEAATPEEDASLEPAVRGGDAPVADVSAAATSTPAPSPTSAPAEAPAAVAAAVEAPPQARPAGVTHGTPTGNRLRPEDGVSTEAQFEGQRAMYDRRKLIDELVATGVPEVSAAGAGRTGSPMLALLYIIIPILAVAFLVAQNNESDAGAGTTTETTVAAGGGGVTLTASGVAFDTGDLKIPAGKPATIEFVNEDALAHNLAFYKSASYGPTKTDPLWTGEEVAAGSTKEYQTTAIDKGKYYFQCDIHPNMNGTLTAE
jgi:plastocyanin